MELPVVLLVEALVYWEKAAMELPVAHQEVALEVLEDLQVGLKVEAMAALVATMAALAEEPVEGKEALEVMAATVPSVSSGELVEASLQLTQVMF